MKANHLIPACALVLALIPACGSDDPAAPPPSSPKIIALTTQNAVLHNLEAAYNLRKMAPVEDLLAPDFTFYPSDGDVQNGLPTQWGRDTEIALTQDLFTATKSIDMDIQFENGVTWNVVDPPPVPSETWYAATAYYHFQMTVAHPTEDITYLSDVNVQAEFTVRDDGTEEAPNWRLVAMRDLGSGIRGARIARSTNPITWGGMMGMYLPSDQRYAPLSQKDDVLHNLELAHNDRNILQYDRLLDGAFVFYLADGDVNAGLPQYWDRGVDLAATGNLLSRTEIEPFPLVKQIEMDLLYENGVQWIEIIPSSAPAETWYTTSVFYNYRVTAQGANDDITFLSGPNAKVQLTVRFSSTGSSGRWQLVEMRDLGSGIAASRGFVATEQSTWGNMKALYRPE